MTGWLAALLAGGAAALAFPSRGDGASRLRRLDAGLGASRRAPRVAAAALVCAAPAYALGGPVATALALAGVFVIRRAVQRRRQAAAADRERTAALDALSILGADLRSGRTPAEALFAAAQVACGGAATGLAAAAAAARLGGDVRSALTAPRSAVAPTLQALAACWQVCSEAGSGLAAAVERLEEGQRAAAAQRRAVTAELAGPRATAQLLAVLPVVGIGLAAALGARPLDFLFGTPVGVGCLAVAVGLDALGLLWTGRLADGAVR